MQAALHVLHHSRFPSWEGQSQGKGFAETRFMELIDSSELGHVRRSCKISFLKDFAVEMGVTNSITASAFLECHLKSPELRHSDASLHHQRCACQDGSASSTRESFAEIHWNIPESTLQGLHRICHCGTRKTMLGDLEAIALHPSNWLATTVLGTPSLTWALLIVQLATVISHRMKGWLANLERFHLQDFHGCSKTFFVHD